MTKLLKAILINPNEESASYLEIETDEYSSYISDIVGDNSNMVEIDGIHQFYYPNGVKYLEKDNDYIVNLFTYSFDGMNIGPFSGDCLFISTDGHGSSINCEIDIDEFNRNLVFIEGKIKNRKV